MPARPRMHRQQHRGARRQQRPGEVEAEVEVHHLGDDHPAARLPVADRRGVASRAPRIPGHRPRAAGFGSPPAPSAPPHRRAVPVARRHGPAEDGRLARIAMPPRPRIARDEAPTRSPTASRASFTRTEVTEGNSLATPPAGSGSRCPRRCRRAGSGWRGRMRRALEGAGEKTITKLMPSCATRPCAG